MTAPDKKKILATVDPLHQEDIHNAEHASFFFQTEDYSLLISRFFHVQQDELVGISTPFLIFEDAMYMFDRSDDAFIPMSQGHVSIQRSIEKQLDYNERLIERYIEQIDRLEDSLYTRKISPIFLDVWFDLKKDLTRMDRMFERTLAALRKYIQRYGKNEEFPKEEFINILEHIERYQRLADLNTVKLDTLYNYYNSLKNDKINNNIYVLTILSGVFLPLNLIVGFFGMNTEGLFFAGDASGTQNVVLLLSILFVILLALFPLVRFVEHYILSKLLGRFNLYNTLVEGIKKFSIFPRN
ncbi:MAG: CorA family divalent cation transporter [Sulfurimonadaceae bacterium]|nr:CorA family divalent cation transporter [Sulfurimonadaceae bacterium]